MKKKPNFCLLTLRQFFKTVTLRCFLDKCFNYLKKNNEYLANKQTAVLAVLTLKGLRGQERKKKGQEQKKK